MFKNIFSSMPYAADHKDRTRARIVDSARMLFNRHGFERVTIDDVMRGAGLTRGGFTTTSRTRTLGQLVSGLIHVIRSTLP